MRFIDIHRRGAKHWAKLTFSSDSFTTVNGCYFDEANLAEYPSYKGVLSGTVDHCRA